MPNDLPLDAKLSAPGASGVSTSSFAARVRRLAPYAVAAGALGFVVATAYRRRYSFENKIVVITGGSRGLGLALARELASRGASLGLIAHDAIELARARTTIDSGSLVQLLPADVSDPAQVEQAFSTAVRRFGRIDVVINSAGHSAHVMKAALPHLARHGEGRVVNISAIDGQDVVAEQIRAKGIAVTSVRLGRLEAAGDERAARSIVDAAARGLVRVPRQ